VQTAAPTPIPKTNAPTYALISRTLSPTPVAAVPTLRTTAPTTPGAARPTHLPAAQTPFSAAPTYVRVSTTRAPVVPKVAPNHVSAAPNSVRATPTHVPVAIKVVPTRAPAAPTPTRPAHLPAAQTPLSAAPTYVRVSPTRAPIAPKVAPNHVSAGPNSVRAAPTHVPVAIKVVPTRAPAAPTPMPVAPTPLLVAPTVPTPLPVAATPKTGHHSTASALPQSVASAFVPSRQPRSNGSTASTRPPRPKFSAAAPTNFPLNSSAASHYPCVPKGVVLPSVAPKVAKVDTVNGLFNAAEKGGNKKNGKRGQLNTGMKSSKPPSTRYEVGAPDKVPTVKQTMRRIKKTLEPDGGMGMARQGAAASVTQTGF
jgi:hypothetical protein